MGVEVGGILGLLVLIFNVWAIINISQSSVTTGSKVFWIVLILLLPVIGLVIYALIGPE